MEIRTSDEARENIKTFSLEYIALLLKKKEIADEIKDLKTANKELGVPTAIVSSVISRIIRNKKKSDSEITEDAIIFDWISGDSDIDDKVGEMLD